MTVWYVRPASYSSGTNDGTSYANAWQGFGAINASAMAATDRLLICGAHTYASPPNLPKSGSGEGDEFIYDFTYYADPGSISLSGTYINGYGKQYVLFEYPNITGTTGSLFYIDGSFGITDWQFIGGEMNGGANALGLGNGFASWLSINGTAFNGQSGGAISQEVSAVSQVMSNYAIRKCSFLNSTGAAAAIRLSIESGGYASSYFTDLSLEDNQFSGINGAPIMIRASNPANYGVSANSVMNQRVSVRRNEVRGCGTTAGSGGQHGGFSLAACARLDVSDNLIWDSFAQGGAIETLSNSSLTVMRNDIRHIRSGTPSGSYVNGNPIDGDGIFLDLGTLDAVVTENYIEDLVSTGNINSGMGLAIWTAQNANIIRNVVKNAPIGVSFGAAGETSNSASRNTLITCGVGIQKIGSATGIELLNANNDFIGCTKNVSM